MLVIKFEREIFGGGARAKTSHIFWCLVVPDVPFELEGFDRRLNSIFCRLAKRDINVATPPMACQCKCPILTL